MIDDTFTPERIAEIELLLTMDGPRAYAQAALAAMLEDCHRAIRDLLAERAKREAMIKAFVDTCFVLPKGGELPPPMEEVYRHAKTMRAFLEQAAAIGVEDEVNADGWAAEWTEDNA